MKVPPRVVLDTNVVLSALFFTGGSAARVRSGWQNSRLVPLASTATAQELVRVLAYPKFKLSPDEQRELLADYLPWAHAITLSGPTPGPVCRDPGDAPFIHLAIAGKARALVSGDKDMLALDGAPGLCSVLTIDAFCSRYLAA